MSKGWEESCRNVGCGCALVERGEPVFFAVSWMGGEDLKHADGHEVYLARRRASTGGKSHATAIHGSQKMSGDFAAEPTAST